MSVLGPEDRLLLLRNTIGPGAVSWVERLDPESLEERGRSADLALGPYWPGGIAAMADGAVICVQGCWIHRLDPNLGLEASRRLPVEAPYNSFVVLADGSIATKDIQRDGSRPSTLSILDPVTLEDRAPPWAMSEGSVARLSADGDRIVAVGLGALHRILWADGRLRSEGAFAYRTREDQSFGWDPVIDAGSTWWLDQGDHTFDRSMSMLRNGVAAGPVRLWRLSDADRTPEGVEVSGESFGAVTNPPLIDPARGIALAYDSANGTLAAFSVRALELLWTARLNTAQHLVLFPDTGEVLANDYQPDSGDALVVLDVTSGSERARCPVDSPVQSVVFCTPGTRDDAYYVSLSTVARVEFGAAPSS